MKPQSFQYCLLQWTLQYIYHTRNKKNPVITGNLQLRLPKKTTQNDKIVMKNESHNLLSFFLSFSAPCTSKGQGHIFIRSASGQSSYCSSFLVFYYLQYFYFHQFKKKQNKTNPSSVSSISNLKCSCVNAIYWCFFPQQLHNVQTISISSSKIHISEFTIKPFYCSWKTHSMHTIKFHSIWRQRWVCHC